MKRVITYIDGFNLYFGLRSKGWRRYYWLDPFQLATNLLKPGQRLECVKYFTTRISEHPKDPDKHRRQATWLDAIAVRPQTRLYFGHYLPKEQRCRKCGATWITHEEKKTDVQIAVELLRDAYENAFDVALLISADSDLVPPVEAVRAHDSGKRIIVVCPPNRKSKVLEESAHATFRLGRGVLSKSQLPDSFTKPDGFVLTRPPSWA